MVSLLDEPLLSEAQPKFTDEKRKMRGVSKNGL